MQYKCVIMQRQFTHIVPCLNDFISVSRCMWTCSTVYECCPADCFLSAFAWLECRYSLSFVHRDWLDTVKLDALPIIAHSYSSRRGQECDSLHIYTYMPMYISPSRDSGCWFRCAGNLFFPMNSAFHDDQFYRFYDSFSWPLLLCQEV